jgi:hypothetical protein
LTPYTLTFWQRHKINHKYKIKCINTLGGGECAVFNVKSGGTHSDHFVQTSNKTVPPYSYSWSYSTCRYRQPRALNAAVPVFRCGWEWTRYVTAPSYAKPGSSAGTRTRVGGPDRHSPVTPAPPVGRPTLIAHMIIIIIIIIIQFFIYLRAELNSQWPITESARIQTETAIRQHRTKKQEVLGRTNSLLFLTWHGPH